MLLSSTDDGSFDRRDDRSTPAVSFRSPSAVRTDVARRATELAEELLTKALKGQTDVERVDAERLARMMNDPVGKAFTFTMIDAVFRSRIPSVIARRWRELLHQLGIPRYLSWTDRSLMGLGSVASLFLPGVVMPAVAARLRADSSRVILPGERDLLNKYLKERSRDGFRINLNHLGEAVLGEEEALNRLAIVLDHLANPLVNYVSVKISAIYSQINLIAWDQSLTEIKARLRTLYFAAARQGKFINLDMEEYKDLELTVTAFCEVLDEPEFQNLSAGIVLQAYLPDSWGVQQKLTDWAQRRVARGGAPIRVRIVKGANLAMEAVEAEMHGWHPAPYATKHETDANYRRMVEFGVRPENAAAVHLGVASHNLFDVALALTLRQEHGVEHLVEIEMLEGMANHQARAVRDEAGTVLLYAPAVRKEDFLSAMAYLVRRLDENTAPENFLRELFSLKPGSEAWEEQKARFLYGWEERLTVSDLPRRRTPAVVPESSERFLNEPDTDWTQREAREELQASFERWAPSSLPDLPELNDMLDRARQAQLEWEAIGSAARAEFLNQAALLMREERFNTMACMRREAKKSPAEADGEVSEAIDFARYYARHANPPAGAAAKAMGVIAVVSPWNFPYAIPAGGVMAALVAGNSVILKPAPSTVQTAWTLVNQLWNAGVPRDVLHFYPCSNEMGQALITDFRVAGVILTGSYETARKFQGWRPSLPLYAETSGKNALIITAQADRDLAIKDLIRSAFSHSGQKCSAASLAILEEEVYDDPDFRRQLRDAAASLHVGPAIDARSVVTPLILSTSEKLIRGLTTLDEGEEWLLKPVQDQNDPALWSPGIKLGVKPGSWFHQTECFGPVLGLMRASSLAEAVEWQNNTPYGLTAGIHSLDPADIEWWRDQVQAGNLYINRGTTGAIVQRQPFGGWKRSCIGPGAKAGGPNYVFSFSHWEDEDRSASEDYRQIWQTYFSLEHDPSQLASESNVFRYQPAGGVILRLETPDPQVLYRAKLAANITGTPLTISIRTEEPDDLFVARLPQLAQQAEFLRTIVPPSDEVLMAAYDAGLNWINAPVLRSGRIELLRWMREQSISETRHRYGQLPDPSLSRR